MHRLQLSGMHQLYLQSRHYRWVDATIFPARYVSSVISCPCNNLDPRYYANARVVRGLKMLTKPQSVSRISRTSKRASRRTWPFWLTVPRPSLAPLSPISKRIYSGLKSLNILVIKRTHPKGFCSRYSRHLSRWWWWRVLGSDPLLSKKKKQKENKMTKNSSYASLPC